MNANENEKTAATQCDRILQHLKTGATITAIEALNMFGCFRLAARIADLRKKGNEIVTDKVTTGTGKHVAQYRLAIR